MSEIKTTKPMIIIKRIYLYYLLSALLTLVGSKAYAYDLAVANDDGVTIYYNYIIEKTALGVTEGDSVA